MSTPSNIDTSPHLILGAAGHIDHGKSSLIKALTGVDPDRLKEEKDRGITIELGFARLDLPEGIRLGVVDVPGHESFVRQMISGSTGIDIALLCIAADDGIMPQTIEHLAILQLLGVRDCLVALTKTDLVDAEWIEFLEEEIRSYLSDGPYAAAPIVATSSKTNEGFDNLKATLAEAVRQHQKIKRGTKTRLPVDRVFTIKGSGTVVTGTLWSGSLTVGDQLSIARTNRDARLRSIQVHGEPQETCEAGNRVALNLHGLTTEQVRPGDFLVSPHSFPPTGCFNARFTYMDVAQTKKPLKSGVRVHVSHGTKEVIGRIFFIGETELLKPQESCFAQFRLDERLSIARGDRFIVRSYSPVHVIGGGAVVHAHPRRTTRLSPEEYGFLSTLEQGSPDAIVEGAAALQKKAFTPADLEIKLDIDLHLVHEGLSHLLETGAIQSLSQADAAGHKLSDSGSHTWYLPAKLLQRNMAKLDSLLMTHHSINPESPGLPKGDLRNALSTKMAPDVLEAFVNYAAAAGKLVVDGGFLRHPSAGLESQEAEAKAASLLLETLTNAGSTPPSVQELLKQTGVDAKLGARALGQLEKDDAIVRINKEYCYAKPAYSTLQNKVAEYLNVKGTALANELKEAMGTSRKYAIPLLEHFDSVHFTIRSGDTRSLGQKR